MNNLNFTSPCNQLGMGIVGLNLIRGLFESGISLSYFPLGQINVPRSYSDLIDKTIDNSHKFDANAPSIRYWHPNDMAHHVGRGRKIGYTIFESTKLTEGSVNHLNSQDIVIVPSAWAKKVLLDNSIKVPINVVNHAVDHSIFYTMPFPSGPTTFYISGKWEVRKAHCEVAIAFNKAFEYSDDVRLIVNCNNPFLDEFENQEWISLFRNSQMGKFGKIEIIRERLETQQEVAQLMAKSHCGIFPSRAEGWNLPLCEMLSMGRHVITTDYSAHTEYITPSSCKLISIDKLESCYDGKWFNGDGEWAHLGNKQMEQMIWHMRSIHKSNMEGSLSLNVAGINRMKDFTWEKSCEQLMIYAYE